MIYEDLAYGTVRYEMQFRKMKVEIRYAAGWDEVQLTIITTMLVLRKFNLSWRSTLGSYSYLKEWSFSFVLHWTQQYPGVQGHHHHPIIRP